MTLCQVCSKNKTASYKCRICRTPYCTINCFKVHKQSKCEKLEDKSIEDESKIVDSNYSYVTEDTLPADKLKLLDNDAKLREILSNKHVKDILISIDSCKDPNFMVEQAMKEPIFVEFVDSCLRVVQENKEFD